MYNHVELIGYLAANAEVRNAGQKKAISFRIGTSEKWKDQSGQQKEKSTFTSCVMFASTDGVAKYLTKGALIHVTGKLDVSSYEKDGQKKYVTQVVVDPFGGLHLLEKKGSRPQADSAPSEDVEGQEVPGEDIPF